MLPAEMTSPVRDERRGGGGRQTEEWKYRECRRGGELPSSRADAQLHSLIERGGWKRPSEERWRERERQLQQGSRAPEFRRGWAEKVGGGGRYSVYTLRFGLRYSRGDLGAVWRRCCFWTKAPSRTSTNPVTKAHIGRDLVAFRMASMADRGLHVPRLDCTGSATDRRKGKPPRRIAAVHLSVTMGDIGRRVERASAKDHHYHHPSSLR